MKKLLLTKSLLALLMLFVGTNVWGQISTWTSASGTYTSGQQIKGSVDGIVTMTLGTDDGWTYDTGRMAIVTRTSQTPAVNNNNIPTAGGYVVITPSCKINFKLSTFSSLSNCNVVMYDSEGNKLKDFRQKGYNDNDYGTLEAGKNYYIYGTSFKSTGDLEYVFYKSFKASTIEDWTIHYKNSDGVTIKDDVTYSGSYGSEVTASESDMANITFENVEYSYSSGNATITLSKETNEITLVYASAPKYAYTINAVAGSTTIKSYEGTAFQGAQYGVSLPKAISYGDKYYVLDDKNNTNLNGFYVSYTMGSGDATTSVNYTLDESIVYFKEAEDITANQVTESVSCSGGKYVGYYAGPTSVSIPKYGVYELETNVVARNDKSSLEVYTAESTVSVAQIAKGGSTGIRTCSFTAAANSTMRVGGPYYNNKFQNSLSFDYVLIRMTAATSVTATIGEAGWATLYTDKALDFSGVEGLEAAYTATIDEDKVVLSKVNDIPAASGVILKGAPGEYEIPFIDASNTAKGILEGNTEVETAWDAYAANNGTLYILASVNNGKDVQFVPCTSGSIAAGKAYLPVYIYSAKAMQVVFASEATGISNVNVSVPVPVKRIQNGQLIIEKNGKTYNAAGQLK